MKKFFQNKKNYNYLYKIIVFILIILLEINKINIINFYNNFKRKKVQNSNKWIVVTVYNKPNSSFLELIKFLGSWKIIIIGNSIKNDRIWKSLSKKIKFIYLTLKEQNNLPYKIIKYLNYNSYYRKNIGYLYAIQHGAKEIYEIDEDIIIPDSKYLNFDYRNNMICYGIRNDSKMINPYDYFNERSLWPRGFRISDIGENENNKYYILNSSQLSIKPLIFQGLINGNPDIDSILSQTRFQKNKENNFTFLNKYPLLYIPGNYI